MFRRRYARALDRAFASGLSAEELTADARVLRFLGRGKESRQAFTAALRRDPNCAAAWAWRWDADFISSVHAKSYSYEAIDRALELEPARGLWVAMRGVGKLAQYRISGTGRIDEPVSDLERALDLDAKCQPALIALGWALLTDGRHHRALNLFDRSLRSDARSSFLYVLRGRCRLGLGDRNGYIADCEKAVYAEEGLGHFEGELDVGSSGGRHPVARKIEAATRYLRRNRRAYWMYLYRGDYRRAPEINDPEEGLKDIEKAVEIKPDCAYAWAYLSRARLMAGNQASALEAADRSVALNPACGWILIWRGEIRRRLRDMKGALSDINRGLKMTPDYELGYAWRGGIIRALGRPDDALADLALARALDPRQAWTAQEYSLTLRQLGRTGEALEYAAAAHRLDPKNSWCSKAEQADAAKAELDAEIKRHPRNASARAWRGHVHLLREDYRAAKRDLDRAIKLKPEFGWARAWRGRVWHNLFRARWALKDFDQAARLEPFYAYAFAWRGVVRRERKDLKGALADMNRAIELNRTTSWIFLWRGEILEALGRLKEAGEDYTQSLGVDQRHVSAMIARAVLRFRQGNRDGARSDLDRALKIEPTNARASLWRGILNERADRWVQARADYLRAIDGAGSLKGPELRNAKRFLRRGPVLTSESIRSAVAQVQESLQAGQNANAAAMCDEALRVDPHCRALLRLRSEAYRCLGEYDKQVADLDRLLALDAKSAEAWVARGIGRRNAMDFEGSLRDAEEGLRRSPGLISAQILKSEALRNMGRFPESIAAASAAIETRRKVPRAYLVRGKARRQGGDWDGALIDLRRAAALAPGDAKVRGWEADTLRRSGRREEAASAAQEAVRLMPTCAWAVALSGEIERERGGKQSGLELVRRAVALDSNGSCAYDFIGADPPEVWRDSCYAWVYAWRGGIFRKKGEWRFARRDLAHAVELDPDCFWARGWLGELHLADGDAEGALAQFAAALKTHPCYVEALNWQGRAHCERGRWRSALASFQNVLSLDGSEPWAMIGVSVCLEKLGRKSIAAKYLQRAAHLAPALFAKASG